jgi:hypothetical protein
VQYFRSCATPPPLPPPPNSPKLTSYPTLGWTVTPNCLHNTFVPAPHTSIAPKGPVQPACRPNITSVTPAPALARAHARAHPSASAYAHARARGLRGQERPGQQHRGAEGVWSLHANPFPTIVRLHSTRSGIVCRSRSCADAIGAFYTQRSRRPGEVCCSGAFEKVPRSGQAGRRGG